MRKSKEIEKVGTSSVIGSLSIDEINSAFKIFMKQANTTDVKLLVAGIESGRLGISKREEKFEIKGNLIYFSACSKGWDGDEWVDFLDRIESFAGSFLQSYLFSSNFVHTHNLQNEIVIIPGTLFGKDERNIKEISSYATKKEFIQISTEDILIMRQKFSNYEFEKMGLSRIIGIHTPIEDLDNSSTDKFLLSIVNSDGNFLVEETKFSIEDLYEEDIGFAFKISKTKQKVFNL